MDFCGKELRFLFKFPRTNVLGHSAIKHGFWSAKASLLASSAPGRYSPVMFTPGFRFRFGLFFFFAVAGLHAAPSSLTSEQQGWLAKASRYERGGWIFLHT